MQGRSVGDVDGADDDGSKILSPQARFSFAPFRIKVPPAPARPETHSVHAMGTPLKMSTLLPPPSDWWKTDRGVSRQHPQSKTSKLKLSAPA